MNSSLGPSETMHPYYHLDFTPCKTHFRLLTSQTVISFIYVVLDHYICGSLLQQQYETDTQGITDCSHLVELTWRQGCFCFWWKYSINAKNLVTD